MKSAEAERSFIILIVQSKSFKVFVFTMGCSGTLITVLRCTVADRNICAVKSTGKFKSFFAFCGICASCSYQTVKASSFFETGFVTYCFFWMCINAHTLPWAFDTNLLFDFFLQHICNLLNYRVANNIIPRLHKKCKFCGIKKNMWCFSYHNKKKELLL